jgi:hypothetical protein
MTSTPMTLSSAATSHSTTACRWIECSVFAAWVLNR